VRTAETRPPFTRPEDRRHRVSTDWTLLIGLVCFGALLALAIYGPLIAPHDFYYVRSLIDGKAPPFAPGPEFPLGSDRVGHDLLSWLLIGARSTLVIAVGGAALRMAIGGFLGTLAGWQGGWKEEFLSRLALGFSSIPATALAVLGVLAFNIYAGTLAFTVALGLLGWGDAFHHARRHARAEGARQFIESARAQGISETRVVLRHLVPNLAPALLTLAAFQVSAVLLLLGELGLIRLFVGGAQVADFDARTGAPSLLLPTQPDWSSMLAQTRPIADLYGTSWMVLVPGLALLTAVVITNLLGDALARRSQHLDVYALFNRRQTLILGALLVALIAPALLWPSRLAMELEAASGIQGRHALTVARGIAGPDFEGRLAGSAAAIRTAEWIRGRWGAELQPLRAQIVTVSSASVRTGANAIEAGLELTALSLASVSVAGTLRDLDRDPARTFGPATFKDQILVTSSRSGFGRSIAGFGQTALLGGATAAVIVDDDIGAYSASSAAPLPMIRIGTSAFRQLTGTLPMSLDGNGTALSPLSVEIRIATRSEELAAANVIARVAASVPDAPLVLVFVPYDEAPYPRYLMHKPGWGTASAVGVASEVLDEIRRAPLPAEIMFVAVGADQFHAAGTTAFVGSLDAAERRRVIAALTVGSLQSGNPFMQVQQPDRSNPAEASAGARVGGRIATALGLRTRPSDLPLRQVLRRGDVSAAVFGMTDLQGPDGEEPPPHRLGLSARGLHVLLAYLARHPGELQ